MYLLLFLQAGEYGIMDSMVHSVETRPILDKAIWEQFLATRAESNFLQSWQWGEFQAVLGKKVVRIGIFRNDTLQGVYCGIIENAKRGRYMAVAGGPIMSWDDTELVSATLQSLKETATQHNCVYVRIRPQCGEDAAITAIFRRAKLRLAPMHLTADLTSQIDLTVPEAVLMSNMRKTTRYELRKAQTLNIRAETSTNPADIDEFYDLQMQTARRHGFVPFSLTFLKEQFKAFAADDNVLLYKAFINDTLLAEAFVIFYGTEGAYHYGSSTEEARKYPGAYLIQWNAMLEAKKRGMTRYNLWGVVPEGVSTHRFSGVSIFKRGFGGHDVAYMPAHDLVIKPLLYILNYGVEATRKKLRRL